MHREHLEGQEFKYKRKAKLFIDANGASLADEKDLNLKNPKHFSLNVLHSIQLLELRAGEKLKQRVLEEAERQAKEAAFKKDYAKTKKR